MAEKNSGFSFGFDFEEMTQVLSENHEQNKIAHKRLAPIIAQKEKLFREKLLERMRSEQSSQGKFIAFKRPIENFSLNQGETFDDSIVKNKNYEEQVAGNPTTCSFFMI